MNELNFFCDFKKKVIYQYEKCKAYKILCEQEKFDPYEEGDLKKYIEQVPFFTTTLFKKSYGLFTNLLNVEPSKLDKWTVSSSTSGDPSMVGRTNEDLTNIVTFAQLENNILHWDVDYECVFFPTAADMKKYKSKEVLGKFTESYIGNLLDVLPLLDTAIFLLKPYDDDFKVDVDSFVNFLKEHNNQNHKLSVRGSTPLLFTTVMELKEKMPPFNLGNNTIVNTGGGGWDGKKGTINLGTKIPRAKFVEEVSKFLGIPEENFVDMYTFTENGFLLNGQYSKDDKDYLFNVPEWCHVIVRDVRTLKPVYNKGDRGILQLLNAYGNKSFAGASILVDDMAEIVSTKRHPLYGEKCVTLKLLGRVVGSEAKGCGATLNIKKEMG